MPKRPSKHLRPPRPILAHFAHLETKRDGGWMVQNMPADRALKTYICPGCQHDVKPGTPHVVVWPNRTPLGGESAVDYRRHWHTACWERRS
ncbi:MAG: hypothetical protein LBR21_10145 [Propionibacteriaceae bacterium]|nr:hypothetical protein [Propionibacteriaceae bacterium]